MSRRNLLIGATVAGAILLSMGALAGAGIGGRGRKKPDTGPFKWPHLQVVKEKLDLNHAEGEAMLRLYNKYEHEEKQAVQNAKTGDKDADGSGNAGLQAQALADIKKALGESKFKRFEELIGAGRKKK